MPVRFISSRVHQDEEGTSASSQEQNLLREPLRIGLVNNMPEAAFKATENQFRFLLNSASEGIPIDLSLYVLGGTPMATAARHRATSHYALVDELWGQSLDGLIVTGAEPSTASLRDEPYWHSFTQLVEWARDNTVSTVWSCLAAHAAVLHTDGIERSRNHTKHFGIFACDRVSDHPLLESANSRLSIPHSRWNGLAEQDLLAHGYEILTRTPDAEVDTFIKRRNSLFVFFQGHPEYETDTLLREYRRDVGRYLGKEANAYPQLPHGYFDGATEKAFASLQSRAPSLHRDQLLDEIAKIMKTIRIENAWQSTAALMYSNWLKYCRTCKQVTHSPESLGASRAACQ
jgi:homoserine O-succinyltransferase